MTSGGTKQSACTHIANLSNKQAYFSIDLLFVKWCLQWGKTKDIIGKSWVDGVNEVIKHVVWISVKWNVCEWQSWRRVCLLRRLIPREESTKGSTGIIAWRVLKCNLDIIYVRKSDQRGRDDDFLLYLVMWVPDLANEKKIRGKICYNPFNMLLYSIVLRQMLVNIV